jgi:hypothetical protein
VNPPHPEATAELEVEVRWLLNRAGADLGEQVSATRTSDGILHVTGILDTQQRKSEILAALGPVADNPALMLDVETIDEALTKQRSSKTAPASSTEVQGVEVQSSAIAAGPELSAYFSSEGKDDEAVRAFAAHAVSSSREAMQHLWAMKKLVNQISHSELLTLSEQARAKWLSILRAHAHAYEQKSARLRGELRPVLFSSAPEGGDTTAGENTDLEDLTRTVEQLFEIGSANDRVIRSAFTASTETTAVTAIKTPQFWQAMKKAEALAGRIQSVK